MKDILHERLLAARRNQILDSAALVFAEKGFHPTTIRDIARAAGVADGTIYNYFANKPALLIGIFDRMRAAVQPAEAVAELSAGDFRSFLTAYFRLPLLALQGDGLVLFRVVASEMMVNPELRALYSEKILEPTLAQGEQILQQWAARHALRPINLALTMRVISGSVLGLLVEHSLGDNVLAAHWAELPDFLADLFMDGMGSKSA